MDSGLPGANPASTNNSLNSSKFESLFKLVVEKEGAVIVVTLHDPLMHLSDNALRLSGSRIEVSEAHLANVSCSNIVIIGGSVTDVREEQFINARSPR